MFWSFSTTTIEKHTSNCKSPFSKHSIYYPILLLQYSFENFDLILLFPGLFDFERAAETEILIQTLLWSLCVMHVIITNVISRRKVKPSDVCHGGNSKHDVGNRFNEEVMDALEQMIKNSVGK